MDIIADLRSDTLTAPGPAMREAMARATVGDDVFGEDPTLLELESRSAGLMGKEAALFVPSGTMGNLLAIKCHTQPGDEVLLGEGSHPFNYESGGASMFAGVQFHPIAETDGRFTADQVMDRIRPDDPHFTPTRLVMIENTHNRSGGLVFPLDRIRAIAGVARENQLATHLDGARLMNAVVATGTPARDFAAPFDTVSMCFSKGLGAPVGSILAGPAELVHRARRYRKVLGGGMRQAGILAAAALHALDHHVDRLAEDHARARRLADALAVHEGVNVGPTPTNILLVTLEPERPPAAAVVASLAERGLRCFDVGPRQIRMVTHLDFGDAQMEVALAAIDHVFGLRV